MNLKPQTRAVLEHLYLAGSITNVEANAVLKCRSVSKRISELEDAHYGIRRTRHVDSQGQRYVRYALSTASMIRARIALNK